MLLQEKVVGGDAATRRGRRHPADTPQERKISDRKDVLVVAAGGVVDPRGYRRTRSPRSHACTAARTLPSRDDNRRGRQESFRRSARARRDRGRPAVADQVVAMATGVRRATAIGLIAYTPRGGAQRGDQQATRRLDRHRNGILIVVADVGEHRQQICESGLRRRRYGVWRPGFRPGPLRRHRDAVPTNRCHRTSWIHLLPHSSRRWLCSPDGSARHSN